MTIRCRILTAASAAAIILGAQAGTVAAQDAAEFFKDKTITVTVGFGPGGGYATYCQQLAAYWPKHIPGNPNVICQFMPGGGGVKAANYMHKVAPRNGTMLGMISDYAAVAQIMRPKLTKYDVRDFDWVGIVAPANPVLMAWHTAEVQTMEEAFDRKLIVGLTGALSQAGINTALMNEFLGTEFERVSGYKSTSNVALAMEKGEVEASMSSWVSWKARKFQMIQEGKYVPVVQVGLTRTRDLPDVPLMSDFAEEPDVKKVLGLASSAAPFGRSVMVPPEYPRHLLEALRGSFMETMKDEEFLRTAEDRHITVDPANGKSLEPVVKDIMNTPDKIVEMAQKAAGIEAGS